MKKTLIFLLLFTISYTSKAQVYDINFPISDEERTQKCRYIQQVFKQIPKEVKFGIRRKGDQLFFEINDKQWFNRIFKNTGDGISIDVVSKSRYACDNEVSPIQIRGTLIKPIYAQRLRRGLKPSLQGRFSVLAGTIPEELQDEELEFNILFLNKKTFCRYNTIFNLESYPWELLDMGVYLDSLTYKTKKIATQKDRFVTKYKTLKFTIPFEKNKSEYSPIDIKPMYDSLRLTDFNIKKIDIKAYSSVEGSIERNIKLQEQRASSIAKSLQSFQKPNIVTEISSSENWVEFLNDIKGTSFENLKSLSKKQVKKKLVGDFSKQMEPYLKSHRKAVITLELDKKDKYKEMSEEKLVTLFNQSIVDDKMEEALVIQNSILDKAREKASPDALKKMNIPKQKKYIPLLTKNSIAKYLINISQTLIVFSELEKLEKLDPTNKKIKYNLAVLKFTIWRSTKEPIHPNKFKKEILTLKKIGIQQDLIDRMLVNFHIVKAEKDLQAKKYEEKDESVEFILDVYENFALSNYDYLSLAQFLTYYSNIYDAIDLLEEQAKSITVDEDLLFYYLNLTLVRPNLTKTDGYRSVMLNAINLNQKRFCKLFNSSLEEGVTFQLLEDEYLRKTYCENCNK